MALVLFLGQAKLRHSGCSKLDDEITPFADYRRHSRPTQPHECP
jgi:hypothetical protein